MTTYHDDPFGFGVAIDYMIATNTVDPLLIPDDLENNDFLVELMPTPLSRASS